MVSAMIVIKPEPHSPFGSMEDDLARLALSPNSASTADAARPSKPTHVGREQLEKANLLLVKQPLDRLLELRNRRGSRDDPAAKPESGS
jgi:hypothetical protein